MHIMLNNYEYIHERQKNKIEWNGWSVFSSLTCVVSSLQRLLEGKALDAQLPCVVVDSQRLTQTPPTNGKRSMFSWQAQLLIDNVSQQAHHWADPVAAAAYMIARSVRVCCIVLQALHTLEAFSTRFCR